MGIERLGMAIVFVDDYPRMKTWYADVLGLKVTDEHDEGQWATLAFAQSGAEIAIHGGLPVGRAQGLAPVVLSIEVSDIEGVVADLKGKGVEFKKDVRLIQEQVKAADLVDPEGNLLQVYEPVARP